MAVVRPGPVSRSGLRCPKVRCPKDSGKFKDSKREPIALGEATEPLASTMVR